MALINVFPVGIRASRDLLDVVHARSQKPLHQRPCKIHFVEAIKGSGILLNAPVLEVFTCSTHGSEMLLVLSLVDAI